MGRKRKALPLIEGVTIEAIAAEGKSLFHWNDLVVFVPWCVPGDVCDVQLRRKKHSFAEGEVVRFVKKSEVRTEPFCQHFGICGGCKWQMLPYDEQLRMKQQQVEDQLRRIGKVELPPIRPIMGSVKITEYRNKLDFGCANKRYLTKEELGVRSEELGVRSEELGVRSSSCAATPNSKLLTPNSKLLTPNSKLLTPNSSLKDRPAIGFHITGAFDKILPIEKCWLMDDLHNDIRNEVLRYATEHGLSFFDLRQQVGLLRDVIIRNSASGEWLVLIQFHLASPNPSEGGESSWGSEDGKKALALLQYLADKFPQITSLMYVDNQKCNDTIGDLDIQLFKGQDYITELMEDLRFKVGPKSFYQTNTEQACHLYKVVRELASPPSEGSGEAIIYDLYTGTGTIANFVARLARKVIGIEYVPEAIEDAKVNSQMNGIDNTLFFAGDMKDILTDEFIRKHGRPNVIITDPPRAGMHPDVVKTILRAAPERIVYVSCNPATQARDLQVLDEAYRVAVVQPVDMFPHTPHVENVVLLIRRS